MWQKGLFLLFWFRSCGDCLLRYLVLTSPIFSKSKLMRFKILGVMSWGGILDRII